MSNIFIAEDHQILIDSIRSLLKDESGLNIVGEANDGEETLEKLKNSNADILILDISMPKLDGIEVLKKLRDKKSTLKILILSQEMDRTVISEAVKIGVNGYLWKSADKHEFLKALRTLAQGNNYFSDEIKDYLFLNKLSKEIPRKRTSVRLTRREKEVLNLIEQGLTSEKIGEKLFISKNTVESHRKNLHSKFNVNNTASLLKVAREQGIIE